MKHFKSIIKTMGIMSAILIPALLLGSCGGVPSQSDNSGLLAVTAAPVQTQDVSAEPAGSADDLTINVSELSETPKFYKAEVNDTKMEIVALVASDGTVRTAFNTCQVCYSSGRGYYEVEGKELVCQNCGNRFSGDMVGVLSGGCNPVPITDNNRSENDGMITVASSLLSKASVIFENWK